MTCCFKTDIDNGNCDLATTTSARPMRSTMMLPLAAILFCIVIIFELRVEDRGDLAWIYVQEEIPPSTYKEPSDD